MNNLPDIKDIQIPDGVSIFPLAYGWWIILGALLLCLFSFWFILKIIRASRKYYALKTLSNITIENPIAAAIAISNLLKRICLFKYKEAKTLYGKDWISFLNKHSKCALDDNAANLLMFAPFMNDNKTYSQKDASSLKDFAKNWIGVNL